MKKLLTRKQMTKAKKLKILKEIRKLILEDWGRCKAKHLTWLCMSCLAGLVVDFLDEWVEDIKKNK